MSEHTDLIPMSEDAAASPGFDLVRRGYDPHQVDAHVGWLEERLREAEGHRSAAEAAASDAATEAARAREDLSSNRPAWEDFGGRITKILQLAEEEGATVREARTHEADHHLEQARQVVAEAGRTRESTIADAEQRARDIVRAAEGEGERIMRESKQTAAVQQRDSERRLADLERQRDQVTNQLSRLRDGLAAAMAPLDAASKLELPAP
jgi:chromosome segregation ATPase